MTGSVASTANGDDADGGSDNQSDSGSNEGLKGISGHGIDNGSDSSSGSNEGLKRIRSGGKDGGSYTYS